MLKKRPEKNETEIAMPNKKQETLADVRVFDFKQQEFIVSKDYKMKEDLGQVQLINPDGTVAHSLSKAELDEYSFEVKKLLNYQYNSKDEYRVCKKNPTWRTIYNVKPRNLYFLSEDALGVTSKGLETVPCFYCGIIMHIDHIQIDHRLPKKSTHNTGYLIVMKILRWANLTEGEAKSKDGVRFASFMHGQPNNIVKPKFININHKVKSKNVSKDADKISRYTLNNQGMIFVSYYFEQIKRDFIHYENSYINLAPACPTCNRTKSYHLFPEYDESDNTL